MHQYFLTHAENFLVGERFKKSFQRLFGRRFDGPGEIAFHKFTGQKILRVKLGDLDGPVRSLYRLTLDQPAAIRIIANNVNRVNPRNTGGFLRHVDIGDEIVLNTNHKIVSLLFLFKNIIYK